MMHTKARAAKSIEKKTIEQNRPDRKSAADSDVQNKASQTLKSGPLQSEPLPPGPLQFQLLQPGALQPEPLQPGPLHFQPLQP